MSNTFQVWQIVREYNSRLKDPAQLLTDDECMDLATIIKRAAHYQPSVPLTFGLAALAQESLFYPGALNDNGEPDNVGSHDIGIAQLHVSSTMNPKRPELASPEAVVEFASDPARAIPFAFAKLAHDIQEARNHQWSASADPRSKNPFWSCAVFYNRGVNGGIRCIEANTAPEHGARVAFKEAHIAQELGLPSVMADVVPS